MDRPKLDVGEKAKWIISAIDCVLDDCEIIAVNDDGTYRIKYQVYGKGDFHERIVSREQLVKIGK